MDHDVYARLVEAAVEVREITHPLEVLLSLLFFNLGVEIGQAIFVGVLVLTAWIVNRLSMLDISKFIVVRFGFAYTIGGIGSFWAIQRGAGF